MPRRGVLTIIITGLAFANLTVFSTFLPEKASLQFLTPDCRQECAPLVSRIPAGFFYSWETGDD